MRGKVLFLLLFLLQQLLHAQHMTVSQLIGRWSDSSKRQTLLAEETYKDLKFYLDEERLEANLAGLEKFLSTHPDDLRLSIRIEMYKTLALFEQGKGWSRLQKDSFIRTLNLAENLGDEQLMSEVYTLYADHHDGSIEEKFFYIQRAVEIQEKIGPAYFPLISNRYLALSQCYFVFEEYPKAIAVGRKGRQLYKDYEAQIQAFAEQYKIIADSYYYLGNPDSSLYYYRQIYKTIDRIPVVSDRIFDREKWRPIVWEGKARGYFLKKEDRKAERLLTKSIERYEQNKDTIGMVSAHNILASIAQRRGQHRKALELLEGSRQKAEQAGQSKLLVEAVRGMYESYVALQDFEQALYLNNYYHNLVQNRRLRNYQSKLMAVQESIKYEKIRNQLDRANSRIVAEKNIRNFILIGVTFCLVLVYALYNKYKLKQNMRVQQLENKRKISELEFRSAQKEIERSKEQLQQFKEKLHQNNLLLQTLEHTSSQETEIRNSLLKTTILTEEDWTNFKTRFIHVFPDFIYSLKQEYPELSPAEIRYLCLIKLGLDHREIAAALGISPASLRVTWHRIKQKSKIDKDTTAAGFVAHLQRKD